MQSAGELESLAEARSTIAGPKQSCDFVVQPLLALSDGCARRPAEVVQRSTRAVECGLTNAWR